MKHRLRRIYVFLIVAAIFISVLSFDSFSGKKSLGTENGRLDSLTHGINVAHWFAQAPLNAERFQTYIASDDIKLIHELGFRHIRLPIDPKILLDPAHPAKLNQENIGYVDAAIDLILSHDLAVIVDIHPDWAFKRKLYSEPIFTEAFATFWRALAHHFSHSNPKYVFLEVMNEPATRDPQEWYEIQSKLLIEMRKGAPEHTLIASANMRVEDEWSDIEGLMELTPVEDTNVVYNFHFYKPMIFTHQGATWGEDAWQYLHNVPYPSDEVAIASLLPKIEDETAQQWLKSYGKQQWNAEKIESLLNQAAEWGRFHQVPVTCNEFGVYRHVAPPSSRSTWLRDVRTSLEVNNIGWAMWEYNAGFGLIRRIAGATPDAEIISALFGD